MPQWWKNKKSGCVFLHTHFKNIKIEVLSSFLIKESFDTLLWSLFELFVVNLHTGNLFVNLDTGNLIMYGYGNPCEAVMTLGQYVRNVHAKDGVPPTEPYTIGAEKALGEGVVDFKRVFTLLKERGYDRYITIEREIEGEEQKRDIERGFIYLKEILKNI